jgi:hypothetical protein
MAVNDEDLIKAALIEDEEDKKAAESGAEQKPSSNDPDPNPDKEKKDPEPPAEAQKKEEDPNPQAAAEEKKDDEPSSDEQRQSRKEKREERKQDFLARIRRDNAPSQDDQLDTSQPHKPMDYDSAERLDVEDLKKDREAYANDKFVEGVKLERFVQNQERFWDGVTSDTRVLESDPKFSFLKEGSDTFDEDLTADINEMYLSLVGYKETPLVNAQGQRLFDGKTGQPAVRRTVDRTDLSYEKFVRNYVERLDSYASERRDSTVKNLAEQSRNGGVRPTGSARKSLGSLKPGDISKMSDEEFEKNEAEIDRQILAELQ